MAEVYRTLCCLRPAGAPGQRAGALPQQAFTIGVRTLPSASAALARHALEDLEEPCTAADQALLEASRDADDRDALLCLRCRVSHPLERKLRWMHGKFAARHGLDLLEMAARVLDDVGVLLPFEPPPPVPERTGQAEHEPFGLSVVRTYRRTFSSLPHWAGVRLQGHDELKRYLREHGLILQSDWSLLAQASTKRIREAWLGHGDAGFSPEWATALHGAYKAHYRAALDAYAARRGKRSGWTPDPAFLEALAPDQPATLTFSQLRAMAQAVRQLMLQLMAGPAADPLPPSDERLAAAAPDASTEDQEGSRATYRLVNEVLHQVMDSYLPAVLAKASTNPERSRCIWRAFADGCNQRDETEQRCGCSQSTVAKTLQLRLHTEEIATRAAEILQRRPPFDSIGRSVEASERMVAALRNHLLTPAQEGDVPPLRHWIARALSPP